MLDSALLTLRAGSQVVYSTRALAPLENAAIIEKSLKKKRDKLRSVESESPVDKPTAPSGYILPNTCGYGPIYFSILERTS